MSSRFHALARVIDNNPVERQFDPNSNPPEARIATNDTTFIALYKDYAAANKVQSRDRKNHRIYFKKYLGSIIHADYRLVTPNQISQLIGSLRGPAEGQRTRRAAMRLVERVFEWAERVGRIRVDPVDLAYEDELDSIDNRLRSAILDLAVACVNAGPADAARAAVDDDDEGMAVALEIIREFLRDMDEPEA